MNKDIPLSDLEVLLFDCQATGANPANGHVVEMAWVVMKGKQTVSEVEENIRSFLVRLPEDTEVPPVVTRITGIKTQDLENAPQPAEVWKSLKETLPGSGDAPVPMVIHFRRYEEPFLRDLHERFGNKGHFPSNNFPYNIICTYQLVRRLLPGLPSKSLRAVAGYLGHSVQEFRRSFHHTSATAMIWRHAVRLLAREKVTTLAEMSEWLDGKKGKSRRAEEPKNRKKVDVLLPMDKDKRKGLPDKPGVYRFLRSNGDLLYIGKATSLKKRVNSYYHKKKRGAQARLTMEMLTQAADLEITVTGSALEAALLENDQIKRYSPPYNVALRQREREIAFFTKDLESVSTDWAGEFPLGPLPSPHSLTAFANILAWLEGRLTLDLNDQEFPALFLGLLPDYAPGIECFREGVGRFTENHNKFLERWGEDGTFTALMVMGKELRRKKLEEMAQALETETEDEDEDVEVEEDRVWMPEDVERMLCGIIRYGARLIRRSRWFRLLSQSSLSWETGETSDRKPRVLVFQNGEIVRRELLDEEGEIPLPPGHKERFEQRGRHFDVVTYDRLRVLTTELRRLVTDPRDRRVQLKLNTNVTLGAEQLLELLKWI